MIYKDGNINELLAYADGKKLVCYGAGQYLRRLCDVFAAFDFAGRIDYVADTYAKKTGDVFNYGDTVKPLGTLERFRKENPGEFVLIITSFLFSEILTDLQKQESLNDVACYVGVFLEQQPPTYSLPAFNPDTDRLIIPKVLHYCWFGDRPIPLQHKKYMESWRKFCPDYEIIEWNEKTYDVTKNRYMREAYQSKKWGFVPDYARLDIIYRYGGVYLDTDVELTKPIDRFLCEPGFCGMHNAGMVQPGSAFGAVQGHEMIQIMRNIYELSSFINEDGTLNLTTSTKYQTDALIKHGLKSSNTIQKIHDMVIYPSDVFNPINAEYLFEHITENTHGIHYFASSWLDNERLNEKSARKEQARDFLRRVEK